VPSADREVQVVVAAERLPEALAVHPSATLQPSISAPPSRASRQWSKDEALAELLRGRMAILGPTTARALAAGLGLNESELEPALLALEADGAILRGHFTMARSRWNGAIAGARAHPRYTPVTGCGPSYASHGRRLHAAPSVRMAARRAQSAAAV
jgi:ATP-dependent Lhr-like helicase